MCRQMNVFRAFFTLKILPNYRSRGLISGYTYKRTAPNFTFIADNAPKAFYMRSWRCLKHMEQKNLDTLQSDIDDHLKSKGFVVFRGQARGSLNRSEVEWDVERYPDFREFLNVADQLGIRLIVFHNRQFSSAVIDRTLEELEASGYEYEDQREIERKLRDLRVYDGFTCALELSFDLGGLTYIFEVRTPWYSDLNDLLDELDIMPEGEDEDDDPLSGYYSKN